jgi:glycosyltransferase involved in cell wall biosynthesis
VYRFAYAIVVQTQSIAEFFPASWRPRIVVIPNPVPHVPVRAPESPPAPAARRTIVAMGRLEKQKGFDLLIRAFAEAADRRPEWDLTILGEGGERAALETLVREHELSGRIALPGREADAAGALRRADLFVLSSRYEGFPNALCEAMACGLPVVAFDCPSGPAEIVRDGVDGRLVPAEDVPALAAAIVELTGDDERRRRYGAAAVAVAARFSVERIAAQWERLLVQGSAAAVPAVGEGG